MRNLFLLLCLSTIPAMAADVYTFNVMDPVTVSSPAGITTGWGYSLHNESSSLWLVTTDLAAGTFQHATPDQIFDFPDLAPGATVTVPYDPITPAGLYQIAWDSNAPSGFENSGTFSLSADWWSGDPATDGSFVATAPTANQPYTATATPEPATIGLTAILLTVSCGICFVRRSQTVSQQSEEHG
jgi:hypothetical protein